jgi:hypothetical protein
MSLKYEREGTFFVLTEEEADLRYREKVELLVNKLDALNNVKAAIESKKDRKVTNISITHVPTGAQIKAGVVHEHLTSPIDERRKWWKVEADVNDYLCSLIGFLEQEIMNSQGCAQLQDPDYAWTEYSLCP